MTTLDQLAELPDVSVDEFLQLEWEDWDKRVWVNGVVERIEYKNFHLCIDVKGENKSMLFWGNIPYKDYCRTGVHLVPGKEISVYTQSVPFDRTYWHMLRFDDRVWFGKNYNVEIDLIKRQ